jgi:hypothetical protein
MVTLDATTKTTTTSGGASTTGAIFTYLPNTILVTALTGSPAGTTGGFSIQDLNVTSFSPVGLIPVGLIIAGPPGEAVKISSFFGSRSAPFSDEGLTGASDFFRTCTLFGCSAFRPIVQRHGPARTLRAMLTQEGSVMARAGCTGPVLDEEDIAYTREVLSPFLDAEDKGTAIECLFGDAAGRILGFTPRGLSPWAGLALALHDARPNAMLQQSGRAQLPREPADEIGCSAPGD